MKPTLRLERSLWREGFQLVAGIDEVGRGAWAGPLSVGVAVVGSEVGRAPSLLRDSKEIRAHLREDAFAEVAHWLIDGAVGHASAGECDRFGLRVALALAANRALRALELDVDAVIVDGPFNLLSFPDEFALAFPDDAQSAVVPQKVCCVVKGDQRCASVAAASVLAKVVRDRLCLGLDRRFSGYEFSQNKGYPAPVHRARLARSGPTPEHRLSWSFSEELKKFGVDSEHPLLLDAGGKRRTQSTSRSKLTT